MREGLMMRDPKRIKKILKEVESVWVKFPDLRLGQLLENAGTDISDCIFYVEDDELVSMLKNFNERMLPKESNGNPKVD